ncbi:UNVERIFIED_CONTAM: radical SAM protein [Streptococcus canis]|uniref:radical SAM/SPASM domain-containing protein n=1 Tax=Streptococcus canis TaxID=1329 RepID=UPI002F9627CF
MLLKKNKNIKMLKRDNQNIFVNRLNGKWIKMPSDVADILQYADKMNLNDHEVESMLFDEEDRIFFKNMLEELGKMEFFYTDNEIPFKVDNVSYSITDRCNLRCKHCMVSAKANCKSDFFDTSEIKENLLKIIELNPDNLIITGGEPMLRRDFIEISRFCREHFSGKLTLMTNGTLVNEFNVSELVSCYDSIDISIDGYNEATCSLIRGEGVFSKIINSIRLLSENGMKKINTSMVLSATNANYIDEYILLNKKLGTRPMLRALSFEGRAKSNEEILKKDFSDKLSYSKYPFESTDESTENGTRNKSEEFRSCSCTAGYDQLVIEANGNIYPCNLFIGEQYVMGNIREIDKLKNVFSKTDCCMASCVEKYDPSKYSRCKDCDVSYFCWSCLYSMVNLDDSEFEERCEYKKNILDKVWS